MPQCVSRDSNKLLWNLMFAWAKYRVQPLFLYLSCCAIVRCFIVFFNLPISRSVSFAHSLVRSGVADRFIGSVADICHGLSHLIFDVSLVVLLNISFHCFPASESHDKKQRDFIKKGGN